MRAVPADPNSSERPLWRPPAPHPHTRPLGPAALIRKVWKNPLEVWALVHFEEPIVTMKLPFMKVIIVNAPTAVRRVLFDNAENYPKDKLQRRVNSGVLSEALLMAEGNQWRTQRRAITPMFTPTTITHFTAAMIAAIDELIQSWKLEPDGAVRDVTADLTELTFDVLERTIFSIGLGDEPEEFRAVMRLYFKSLGRIDPFDLLGLPDFVPRLTRFRARHASALPSCDGERHR
jgi:cytochrome P450